MIRDVLGSSNRAYLANHDTLDSLSVIICVNPPRGALAERVANSKAPQEDLERSNSSNINAILRYLERAGPVNGSTDRVLGQIYSVMSKARIIALAQGARDYSLPIQSIVLGSEPTIERAPPW